MSLSPRIIEEVEEEDDEEEEDEEQAKEGKEDLEETDGKRKVSVDQLPCHPILEHCKALLDQIIHTNENVDIDDLIKDLHPKVMLGIPLLEGTSPASCFPRIAVGYDAVCYSYIWSEVFAADLFVTKFKDDLLNLHAGLRFRNKVLAPGGSKDPLEIITDYLEENHPCRLSFRAE
ncbi:hypothetical protein ZWY2020_057837 [Hordeum vulgare]|nr:hypothetical protein ZWY2020_057837 [Hordeum vulgare]